MGRRWGALLLCLGACYRPAAIQRPSTEDALLVVEGQGHLRAVLFEGRATERDLALFDVSGYLWLEYPAGSLTTFLDRAAATAGVVDALEPASEVGTNSSRPLPLPGRALEWTGAEWSAIVDPLAHPTFARFRLPGIDPFECAALGGCFDPSLVDAEEGQYPPCGPCPQPRPLEPPEPPSPPDLGPCLPTWTATTVAGFAACSPPTPCDLAATPATCAPLVDCPDRVFESIEASMRIGGPGCGGDDWPCDLAAGLAILVRDGITTATIALSEGEHSLDGGFNLERMMLRGLCPSRTRLVLDGTLEGAQVGLEDLSLLGSPTLVADELSMVDVVTRAPMVIEGGFARITDSLFVDGDLTVRSASTAVDRSRFDGVTLVTEGPITIESSVLSRMASIHHAAGRFTLRRSTVEVPGTELDCSQAAMTIRDSTIETWGARLAEGDLCAWSLDRARWGHRSISPVQDEPLWGARGLWLEDVLFTVEGDPVPSLFRGEGEANLARVAVVGPMLEVLDLRDVAAPQIEDLELRFTFDASMGADPDHAPTALQGDARGEMLLRRAKFVGPSGMAIDFRLSRDAGPMPGFNVIEDLEIDGARLAGFGAQFSAGRLTRVKIENIQGSAINLYLDATFEVFDVSVRNVRAIPGGCRRFVGLSCQGTGLLTQVSSQLVVERFSVEDTQGAAIASAGGGGSLTDGWIRSPLAFFLDRYVGRDESLLLGVHVEVGESGTILERGE